MSLLLAGEGKGAVVRLEVLWVVEVEVEAEAEAVEGRRGGAGLRPGVEGRSEGGGRQRERAVVEG